MIQSSPRAAPGFALAVQAFGQRCTRLSELVVVAMVLLTSALMLRGPLVEQEFTVDEGSWIATSRYFWTAFIDRDLFGTAWQPSYEVLTQPPVARYVIGFGLWLQGWTPEQLNGLYQSRRDRAFNEAAGNVPSPPLLAASRRIELVLAVGSVGLLYLIGRTLFDRLTGLFTVALTLGNPLLSALWTRALAEAPLAFFSLLSLLLALKGLSSITCSRTQIRDCVGAAVALGLAFDTKISGLLGGVGLAYFFGLQQSLAVWRTGRLVKIRCWVVFGFVAVSSFILFNPTLYRNPIGNTALLFQFRMQEMQDQRLTWPANAVPRNLAVQSALVIRNVFLDDGTLAQVAPLGLDGLLFIVGFAASVRTTAGELKAGKPIGLSALFLCWLLATYVGSVANLGFDSGHYYAPMVQLSVVLEGLALSSMTVWLLNRIRRPGPRSA